MLKVVNLVGARPQIIKASAISRAIAGPFSGKIKEIVVHTGQHYDHKMSDIFFEELKVPQPDINLHTGSGSHGVQTGTMIIRVEKMLNKVKPDVVILYGDTNSTMAGSVAAAKMHIPVVHIEAGMRSFNKNMPEEINRIICDHVSTLLFSPTITGFKNLIREGFTPENTPPYHINNPKIYHSGDIMYDNSLFFGKLAEKKQQLLKELGIKKNEFALVTIHRDHNTDNPERLAKIFEALMEIGNTCKVPLILPLHPRAERSLSSLNKSLSEEIKNNSLLKIISPVSFLEMTLLEKTAGIIMTDSGGVQKESHFFKKACLVFRPETEWVELVNNGTAVLVDADKQKILKEFKKYWMKKDLIFPEFYGDGHTAEFICREILDNLSSID
ncbi:MAG TPA: UDP-N-acetylglucosamine 2-epimerase (non-hydrolyzing) [Bacteroidetes bacterium]|nr:UDP-N-acetylglucosamine 2-epimerase (non-hydrolyzing) [Bacteroidota bacterium]